MTQMSRTTVIHAHVRITRIRTQKLRVERHFSGSAQQIIKKKKKNGVWFPDLETEIHSFLNLSTSILYSTYEKKEKEKKKKKKICTRDVYSVRNLYERGVMSENITSDRRQNGRNIWNAAG